MSSWLSKYPKDLQRWYRLGRKPKYGMGVTQEYLDTHCLKPGGKCPRFHSVSISEGEWQGVICVDGPYNRCEVAMERYHEECQSDVQNR